MADKKWKKGMRVQTIADVDVWSSYKKALFTRNVRRAVQLRRARINAELSQTEVANTLGISGASYCNWESGKRDLTTEIVNDAIRAMTKAIRQAA